MSLAAQGDEVILQGSGDLGTAHDRVEQLPEPQPALAEVLAQEP